MPEDHATSALGETHLTCNACLQSVKNSDSLRALVGQLQPEQIRISQRLSQSSPLYSKFQAIRNASDSWSQTQTRILDNIITSARLAGAALEVRHLICTVYLLLHSFTRTDRHAMMFQVL